MYLSRGAFRYSEERSEDELYHGQHGSILFVRCLVWITQLPLVLKSSTRMISSRRCGGDLLSTLCTERSSVDHTSSTKQKITLVEGRSSWTRVCAQLDEGDKNINSK